MSLTTPTPSSPRQDKSRGGGGEGERETRSRHSHLKHNTFNKQPFLRSKGKAKGYRITKNKTFIFILRNKSKLNDAKPTNKEQKRKTYHLTLTRSRVDRRAMEKYRTWNVNIQVSI